VIAANTWASQVVGAHVLKDLLQRVGQRAELKPVAADLQVAALGEGELHVQAEIRESVTGEAIDRAVQAKRLRRAGVHEAKTREGWWYPEYARGCRAGRP
jgi:glycine betaine/proline transport system substrate-binding protein